MTPLALKVGHELALPISKRCMDDQAGVMAMIGSDLHCFEVSAIGNTVSDAMQADDLWNDAATMLPHAFLPSPVTWLEMAMNDDGRLAWVIEEAGNGFRLSLVRDVPTLFSMRVCEFHDAGVLAANRIAVKSLLDVEDDPLAPKIEDMRLGSQILERGLPFSERLAAKRAQVALHEAQLTIVETSIGKLTEVERFGNLGIVWSLLVLDLINTPGLIGLRQHDPHRGLARKLYAPRGGSYPLQGWSEVVLKHQTKIADDTERHTGATFHKCLHFVRSHLRHYRDGKVTTIPAHWRGDPALGIKRTRYRLAA